ncbi:MAG: hypothetical protein HPY69_19710, partial [Armatimonadetes bacterium]|nr:hypothetical protein [Armatimonadota bacterium]
MTRLTHRSETGGGHLGGRAPRLWLTAAILGCAALARPSHPADQVPAASTASGTALQLTLSAPHQALEDRLFAGLKARIPAGPMATWPPAQPLPPLASSPLRLENPIDLVEQYRVPPDYCPGFLPEYEPQATADQMCHRDLLTNWQLLQGGDTNPFVVATEQVTQYNADSGELRERVLWALAYAWVHRGHEDTLDGIVDVLLSDRDRVRDDVLLSVAAPRVLELLPEALTEVTPVSGEVPVDLRMTLGFAHDSVAEYEETLTTAGRRGLGALVIAGRGQLGDAQVAQRAAHRLKQRGTLAPDFRVI